MTRSFAKKIEEWMLLHIDGSEELTGQIRISGLPNSASAPHDSARMPPKTHMRAVPGSIASNCIAEVAVNIFASQLHGYRVESINFG